MCLCLSAKLNEQAKPGVYYLQKQILVRISVVEFVLEYSQQKKKN